MKLIEFLVGKKNIYCRIWWHVVERIKRGKRKRGEETRRGVGVKNCGICANVVVCNIFCVSRPKQLQCVKYSTKRKSL